MKFAEMATAVLHSHHGSSATSSNDNMAETAEHDKQFVAHFDQQHPLPPSEVQQDPRNKELGRSSKGLSVHDFELVRTLGTGMCYCRLLLVKWCDAGDNGTCWLEGVCMLIEFGLQELLRGCGL
jgi:protein kinase A